MIKKFAAILPDRWQYELKRIHYARKIHKGSFLSSEPEYKIIEDLICPGDWVIDIGANVGHYTRRFSELVGPKGRVIAIEPVLSTFSLLAANVHLFNHNNVTLFNAAASNKLDVVGIIVPHFKNGLKNYYEARISSESENSLSALTLTIDSIFIEKRISLIKIDAEGHEILIFEGMRNLIRKYHPFLIIETNSEKLINELASLGYLTEKFPESPNILFKPDLSDN